MGAHFELLVDDADIDGERLYMLGRNELLRGWLLCDTRRPRKVPGRCTEDVRREDMRRW